VRSPRWRSMLWEHLRL